MKAFAIFALTTAVVVGCAGGAMAADLAVPAAPVVAAPAPTNWDGPYIGANIGYSWAFADHQPAGGGTGNDINLSGFEVGGQIGYLFHLSDNVVGGVEGSLDWSNQTGSITPVFGTTTQKINWEGMVVAKLGLDVGGNLLPYIDGGFAFANSNRANTAFTTNTTNTQTGWTVGIGAEAMFTDHISGFVSYNYADYGTAKYNTGGIPPTIHLTDNIVKAGLNFHM
jgi:opacity protein-like surface antigen